MNKGMCLKTVSTIVGKYSIDGANRKKKGDAGMGDAGVERLSL
jgi:hypothetical protein